MNENKPGTPFLIIAGTIVILVGLSFVPWSDLTNDTLKDFNLIADLCTGTPDSLKDKGAEGDNGDGVNQLPDSAFKFVDKSADGISLYELENPKSRMNNVASDGTIIIEDYSPAGQGLKNFKKALANRANRPARVAVIGDSYIEGDIITMNLRESLQNQFGGTGVGYMPAHSDHASFRQTVGHTAQGWERHEIRKSTPDMKTLSGEYFSSRGNANVNYKGVDRLAHLDSWTKTTVLAKSKNGGTVTLIVDSTSQSLPLPADNKVHALTVNSPTTTARLDATSGVEVLGVFLDSNNGVLVDNMSIRGNQGTSHRELSVDLAEQMRPYVDYDLIIVEYGINTLNAKTKNYDFYSKQMRETISRLKDCYPNADILMLGIGDRGQKSGGSVKSLPTAASMTEAQRDAARYTGVLFWDIRAAMGGEDAVVKWRQDGLINPDYIHLNHKGGQAVSDLLYKAIMTSLK